MVRAICTIVYVALQLVNGMKDDMAESSLIHFRSRDENLAHEAAPPAWYESRSPDGKCTWDDKIPGAPLGKEPHTIVMSLKFETSGYSKRQWIFNLGQDTTGAEHWLWNNGNNVQFGTWNGHQVATISDITKARTLATVYQNGNLKVYMDGVLVPGASKSVPGMDITSDALAVGSNAGYPSEDPFKGCIHAVDVYRVALSDHQIFAAARALMSEACADGTDDVIFSAGKVVGCDGDFAGGIQKGQSLCAAGWKVCKSGDEVSSNGVDAAKCKSCDTMASSTFYATSQSGPGNNICNPADETGKNDLWGCGCSGPVASTCGVLAYRFGSGNNYKWKSWSASDGLDEVGTTVKASGHGGVMCCKQAR